MLGLLFQVSESTANSIFNYWQKIFRDGLPYSFKTPHKKPKKGELNPKQREENKQISSLRIFVEHTIGLMKIFRIAQERFRLKVAKYKSVIETISGLVRLRIGALILDVVECSDRVGEISITQRHLWSDFLAEEP